MKLDIVTEVRVLACTLAIVASVGIFSARVVGEETPEHPDMPDGIHCSFCSDEDNEKFWIHPMAVPPHITLVLD